MPAPTQGKCAACRRRCVWRGRPLLREAYCPRCGGKLERTTSKLRWALVQDVATTDEAARLRQDRERYRTSSPWLAKQVS